MNFIVVMTIGVVVVIMGEVMEGEGEMAEVIGGEVAEVMGGEVEEVMGGEVAEIMEGEMMEVIEGEVVVEVMGGEVVKIIGGEVVVITEEEGEMKGEVVVVVVMGGEVADIMDTRTIDTTTPVRTIDTAEEEAGGGDRTSSIPVPVIKITKGLARNYLEEIASKMVTRTRLQVTPTK